MNKHEELTNEQFRNTFYYHLTQKKISKETYDLVIAERDISEQTEKELETTKKELELYKAFVNEFQYEIVKEHNSNDTENWDEEYLSHGGATDKAVELYKQIQELRGK
jgi:phage terminase large subunit-like protein